MTIPSEIVDIDSKITSQSALDLRIEVELAGMIVMRSETANFVG